ncbi:MAG: sigma-70 family RNA polymerase sigma factor [Verrucomicrobiales bacterium]|nr:sigma-70 family RNA polymerase sigma factor [Verrucomicrobiales bacterium]
MSDPHRNTQAFFATTRWSIVAQSQGEGPDAQHALETLCRTYWEPLYAFARRSGQRSSDAEDSVQSYFRMLVEKELFTEADADRGKLRTFLLTTFRRFITDEHRHASAQKRGGAFEHLPFDAEKGESWYERQSSEESAEKIFDRRWALTVMEQAMKKLRDRWESRGKVEQFDLIRPYLTAPPEPHAYAEIGEKTGLGLSGVKSAVARLRSQFGEFLRAEVRETQLDEKNFEEEMQALFSAFS